MPENILAILILGAAMGAGFALHALLARKFTAPCAACRCPFWWVRATTPCCSDRCLAAYTERIRRVK